MLASAAFLVTVRLLLFILVVFVGGSCPSCRCGLLWLRLCCLLLLPVLRVGLAVIALVRQTEGLLLEVEDDLVSLLLEDAFNVLVAVCLRLLDMLGAFFEKRVDQLVDVHEHLV